MATKLMITLALLSSLVFISLVIPEFKNEEEISYATHALHLFYRAAGGRKLMQNFALELSNYLNADPGAVAPAPGLAPSPSGQNIDCGGLCKQRCSLNSRENVCLRACRSCCERCGCVPPGTYGNREMCGKCYTDMKTHGNETKCP